VPTTRKGIPSVLKKSIWTKGPVKRLSTEEECKDQERNSDPGQEEKHQHQAHDGEGSRTLLPCLESIPQTGPLSPFQAPAHLVEARRQHRCKQEETRTNRQ